MAAESDFGMLERSFWSNIAFSEPLYGADTAGTMFDRDAPAWVSSAATCIIRRSDHVQIVYKACFVRHGVFVECESVALYSGCHGCRSARRDAILPVFRPMEGRLSVACGGYESAFNQLCALRQAEAGICATSPNPLC